MNRWLRHLLSHMDEWCTGSLATKTFWAFWLSDVRAVWLQNPKFNYAFGQRKLGCPRDSQYMAWPKSKCLSGVPMLSCRDFCLPDSNEKPNNIHAYAFFCLSDYVSMLVSMPFLSVCSVLPPSLKKTSYPLEILTSWGSPHSLKILIMPFVTVAVPLSFQT